MSKTMKLEPIPRVPGITMAVCAASLMLALSCSDETPEQAQPAAMGSGSGGLGAGGAGGDRAGMGSPMAPTATTGMTAGRTGMTGMGARGGTQGMPTATGGTDGSPSMAMGDAGVASPQLDASTGSPASGCTRDSLRAVVTSYFAALAAHDPMQLSTASSVRFTENAKDATLGEGVLWKTAGHQPRDPLDQRGRRPRRTRPGLEIACRSRPSGRGAAT